MIADISDAMMREQSRTMHAFWLYICQHKALPPPDSIIMRHLMRAWSCDPVSARHTGLCHAGIDLLREAIRNTPDCPNLPDAIAGFELWLRADEAHRAEFVSTWEMAEVARAVYAKRLAKFPLQGPEREYAFRSRVLEHQIYMRHRYLKG